jgi:hypothetical protein
MMGMIVTTNTYMIPSELLFESVLWKWKQILTSDC